MQINIFFSEYCIILNPNLQLLLFQVTTQFKLYESEQARNKLLSPLKRYFFKGNTERTQKSARGGSPKHRPGIILFLTASLLYPLLSLCLFLPPPKHMNRHDL